jgi:phosphoribosylaminoimidazole carboxylase PurE protein
MAGRHHHGQPVGLAHLREAASILDELGVAYETRIVSAHRTPDRLWEYGKTAVDRGLKVIIAGAGGAAHLPGMMASKTRVPVIGVPVQTKALSGVDSLYSIVQMPRGYPVATMAIGAAGAANAGSWPPRSSPRTTRIGRAAGHWRARRCRPPSPRRPAMTEPLPSGSTIGILGGGQLGRMLSVAASRLGYRTHIYEPGAAPAADVSAAWTQAL